MPRIWLIGMAAAAEPSEQLYPGAFRFRKSFLALLAEDFEHHCCAALEAMALRRSSAVSQGRQTCCRRRRKLR